MNGLLTALRQATDEDLSDIRKEIAALQGIEQLLAGRLTNGQTSENAAPPTRKTASIANLLRRRLGQQGRPKFPWTRYGRSSAPS